MSARRMARGAALAGVVALAAMGCGSRGAGESGPGPSGGSGPGTGTHDGRGSHDGRAAARPPLAVAGAADLAHVMPELAAAFEAETGRKVSASLGSSGLLAKQLENGAPFAVYLSAQASFVDGLVTKGVCDGSTRAVYGYGRVGVWSKLGALGLEDLRDPKVKRIAIPSPEHAPYGAAAKQALERVGVWADVAPRLVYAENARQSLQLAESGNVEAAFVPLPLASDGGPERAGAKFALVDAALHAPLAQAIVRCGAADPDADRFIARVTSPEGQALLRRYGFYVPAPAASVAAPGSVSATP